MNTYRARTKENISGLSNGLLCLVNRIGSGKKVTLFQMDVRNVTAAPNVATDIVGIEELVPITAFGGGDDIDYTKMDSTNGDLPSQVSIKEGVSDITTTASATVSSFLRRNLNYRYNNIRGLFPLSQGGGEDVEMGGLQVGAANDQSVQGIVLREGEGIAWRVSNLFWSNFYRVHVLFATAAGATYCVDNEYNFRQNNECTFVLFNGSGSGVVLTVQQFCVEDTGDDTTPAFAIIPIDDVWSGREVTVLALDSTNPSLPSTIKVITDGMIVPRGYGRGDVDLSTISESLFGATSAQSLMQWQYWWDRTWPGARYSTTKHVLSGYNPGQSLQFFQAWGGDMDAAQILADAPLVLHEGEGVAIVQMQPDQVGTVAGMAITSKSSRFNYNVIAMFGVEDETSVRTLHAYAPLGASPRIGVS